MAPILDYYFSDPDNKKPSKWIDRLWIADTIFPFALLVYGMLFIDLNGDLPILGNVHGVAACYGVGALANALCVYRCTESRRRSVAAMLVIFYGAGFTLFFFGG